MTHHARHRVDAQFRACSINGLSSGIQPRDVLAWEILRRYNGHASASCARPVFGSKDPLHSPGGLLAKIIIAAAARLAGQSRECGPSPTLRIAIIVSRTLPT